MIGTGEIVYDLTLFVSGASDLSARAIVDARALCDLHLAGHYRLAFVDVHEDPATAAAHQVVAAPALVRHLPLPVRTLVGALTDPEKVRLLLDLPDNRTADG